MNSLLKLAAAFAAGAAIMYFLDPETGRRRRVKVREQGVGAGHDLGDFARTRSKRAADRVRGAVARTRARVVHAPVDDDLLRDRIRSNLGHLVDHPGAVNVQVHGGHVVLGGNAAQGEIERLLDAVEAIPGVEAVDNRLVPGATAEARH